MRKYLVWDVQGDWSLMEMVEALERHGMPQAPGRRVHRDEIKRVLKAWAFESGWIAAPPFIVLALFTRWHLPENQSSYALAHMLAREIGTEFGWEETRFATKPHHKLWCRPEVRFDVELLHQMLHDGHVDRVDRLDRLEDKWQPVHQTQEDKIDAAIIKLQSYTITTIGAPAYCVITEPTRCTVCGSEDLHLKPIIWNASDEESLKFERPGECACAGAVYFLCPDCFWERGIAQTAQEKIKLDLDEALRESGVMRLVEKIK